MISTPASLNASWMFWWRKEYVRSMIWGFSVYAFNS